MLLNSSRVLTILASSCVLLLTPTQCSLVAASPAPPPPLPEGTALNINLAQPLFDGFKPIFNSLLVRNLNKLAIPDLDVALPAVPGVIDVIDFHVRNLKTVNSTIKPASGIKIGNGALKLNFVGVGLGLQGDYNVTLSNKTNAGSVGVYTELGIRGDLRIVRGSNGDLNVLIPTLEILFTKLNIMFTEADLDERIQKLQEAYGPIIKGVLGMFLTTSTKELIIPLLNMLLSNQISLGFNGGPGSTSASFLKTKVIGQPTISIADGVNVPLSLEFVKV